MPGLGANRGQAKCVGGLAPTEAPAGLLGAPGAPGAPGGGCPFVIRTDWNSNAHASGGLGLHYCRNATPTPTPKARDTATGAPAAGGQKERKHVSGTSSGYFP